MKPRYRKEVYYLCMRCGKKIPFGRGCDCLSVEIKKRAKG